MRSSLYGIYATTYLRGITRVGFRGIKLEFAPSGFQVRCFAAQRRRSSQQLPKVDHQPPMEDEKDEFYVVRKGDIIGIYKSLSDCQAQVGSSVCDPSVSVYKGYALRKETEEYLASRGLRNPLYTLNAADITKDLFDGLVPCPFQQPDDLAFLPDKASKRSSTLKRSKEKESVESGSTSEQSNKLLKLGSLDAKPVLHNNMSCILEFDGASKGNPGKAGAGAILRFEDGRVISRIREGLGVATNNVAEYRALILGLKHALRKGIKDICVRGDSKLVCMQMDILIGAFLTIACEKIRYSAIRHMEDLWAARNQNMAILCKEAKGLKELFSSFSISHVKREFNSDADFQANLAIDLQIGEVSEDPS